MRTPLTQKLLPMFLLAAFLTACPIVTAQPPPTPLGLSAVATSSTGISVSWVASGGATSYTLERRTDATGFVGVGGKITTTTFADSSLQGATKYSYHIKAVSDGGTSESSPEVSATTPTDLVSLQATATSSSTVNLSWNAVAGATNYTLERKEGSGAYSTVSTPTGTSFTDYTGLTPNTTYTYKVTAQPVGPSAAGEKTVTTFPGNPTNLTSSSATNTVQLTWSAPSEPGTYTYSVERKQGSGAYAPLGTPSSSPFTDSGVTPGITYTYRIKAVSNGNSSSGAEINGGAQLAKPTDFLSSNVTTTKATLSWNAVSGATSYTLTRQVNSGPFDPLTTTSSTSYTDTTITSGNVYTYRLLATNGLVTSPTVDTSVSLTPIKVLFIGNSLTFVNNVPLMIQTLAANEPHQFQFEKVVVSGGSLECHYTQGPSAECASSTARARIAVGGWDAVVLQDFSDQPVCSKKSFDDYVNAFNADIKNIGAKTVIAMNWVKTNNPCPQFSYGNTTMSDNTYARASAIASAVAPLGAAWATLGAPTPTPALYLDDRHANANGSYLAASVYYALFYKKSPINLTRTVQIMISGGSVSNPDETLTTTTIDSGTANTLQTTAWNAYQKMVQDHPGAVLP